MSSQSDGGVVVGFVDGGAELRELEELEKLEDDFDDFDSAEFDVSLLLDMLWELSAWPSGLWVARVRLRRG